MTCGVRAEADVLERAMALLDAAAYVSSPDAFRSVVSDGIARCFPDVRVTFTESGHAVEGQVCISLGPSSNRPALLATSARGFLCATEVDLLTLLTPHLRAAYREACLVAVLTPRQREVLRLVGTGLTNREVARRLRISPGTVRVHLEHSYERLGVGTRTAAIARVG